MRKLTLLLLIMVPLLVVSCTTHTHMVGTGALPPIIGPDVKLGFIDINCI